jgi:hypothetical protein
VLVTQVLKLVFVLFDPHYRRDDRHQQAHGRLIAGALMQPYLKEMDT